MARYEGKARAGPGIYLNPARLQFTSLEDSGYLPGTASDKWYQVPEALMLLLAPLVGLAYVIFLPLIGFVLLGGAVLEALQRALAPTTEAAFRVLRPAWQPARAFLSRGRRTQQRHAPADEPEDEDSWSAEVREELEEPD